MRDILFLIAFCVLLILALKRPFVALPLWLWSGLFVPVYWLYGVAGSISYNTIFAVCTIFSYLIHKNKPVFRVDILFVCVIVFFFFTTITSAFTIAVPEYVWMTWEGFAKTMLLFVFACLIIRKKCHFELFIWAIVLSVGFVGLVESLKFISSGGGHHIKGPSGNVLADNNHFALALSMTIPLVVYLISTTSEKLIRIGLIGMLLLCILAILATHSRGGLIGLVVVGGYFWLNSNSKFKTSIAVIIVIFVASLYLPNSWYERMYTIETAIEDGSFLGRVISWKIHTLMAMERPLLGGGFNAPQFSYIWRSLASDIDKLSFISTPPPGDYGLAAHSIYFQVLGDHGFVGLFLFLLILFIAILELVSIEKFFSHLNGNKSWQCQLAKMLKVSLIAYCIAGGALSLAYVELFYAILALIVCLSLLKRETPIRKVIAKKITAHFPPNYL